jgi:integrase
MNAKNLTARSFKPLLECTGLPRTVRLHDLRHTCATLLLGKGVHPKIDQELLGHATIAITFVSTMHSVAKLLLDYGEGKSFFLAR